MNRNSTIVIIEDDLDDQEVLRDILHQLSVPHELRFFDLSDDAYDYLMSTAEKPFIILCDINLPKVNGIELKKRIDNTEYLRKKAIPFAFLTTTNNQRTIDEAYQITNLQGYFQKGHNMAEIREKVKCIMAYWSAALHPSNQ
jgi:CheY-like chemotaxis protein